MLCAWFTGLKYFSYIFKNIKSGSNTSNYKSKYATFHLYFWVRYTVLALVGKSLYENW